MQIVLMSLLSVTAAAALALIAVMFAFDPNFPKYSAVGELLLVFVLAVEGAIAFFEFSHHQRATKIAANSAVFDLYKMYLSPEYQRNVRRPAWYSLSRARIDEFYRQKLLDALAGETSGDDIDETGVYERSRSEGRAHESKADREAWAFHEECHRVQDIFGFFATLSVWTDNADARVVKLCHFFYDRWRVQLHRIVRDLQKHEMADVYAAELKQGRIEGYVRTLTTLDQIFPSGLLSWEQHPHGNNGHVERPS